MKSPSIKLLLIEDEDSYSDLVSENVSDLIVVVDLQGRRIYNSPSYRPLLGEPSALRGTDFFLEVHEEDRDMVHRVFAETIETGHGHRIEYRMQLKDGSIRFIESQVNAIKDQAGKTAKVVIVSRDITENKERVELLHRTFQELKESHEELKNAQNQLIQSEKLEAVSTFAAGVAHEVKNPLQTIILGVDYLTNHLGDDKTVSLVLGDMADAVHRADSIIRGLLEFSANKKRNVQDEDLNEIIEQSLISVENELQNARIQLVKETDPALPLIKLDFRTMKHVFLDLFMYWMRGMPDGGTLRVRTYCRQLKENWIEHGRVSNFLRIGDTVVVAEVEDTAPPAEETPTDLKGKDPALGLAVLKKIVELYGGLVEVTSGDGNRYTLIFRAHQR